MSNLIRTILSALHQWNATEQRAPRSGKEGDSRYVASPLPRHRISLTATASFGVSGIPEEIRIRDINEKGLYFYTNFDMPIGESLDIVVVLPPDIGADGKGRRVHYEAKVVRVERERGKEQYGVGAAIRRCETFPLSAAETKAVPKQAPAPKPAAAPNRAPTPAPISVQPTKTVQPTKPVQENIQPTPKITTPLRIPKIAEPPPIPKTTVKVEEPIAAAVPTTSDQKVTIQNRRAVVERLATAALRAGISLEELIQLVNSGITPTELVDIIEARLMARTQ